MSMGSYSTEFTRGDTFRRVFTLSFAGVVGNLTGGSAAMELKRSRTPTAPSVVFTPYLSIPTPTNGKIVLEVPASFTANMEVGRYYWDLKYTDASGRQFRYLGGTIDVNERITS